MAIIYPFRALRPQPANAARIAAVPYDVVSADEARKLADDNPLSFLRVSRAEIELSPDIDPYSSAVYERAASNFTRLKEPALVLDTEPSVYFYQLRMGEHQQVGLAACFSLDDYDRNVIKKHERTRRDKEDDRTRHLMALGAQTGPVFLTYRASADVNDIATEVVAGEPLYDFVAPDGVRHSLWRVTGPQRTALVNAFSRVPAMYIADGHHRAASAARARAEIRAAGQSGQSLGDGADFNTFLAVAFPHDQVQILPYNRIVKDLAGLSDADFRSAVSEQFDLGHGPAVPLNRGDIAMYLNGRWHTLRSRVAANPTDAIASLDVSVLQDQLLAPILKIADVRTDKRIDFRRRARAAPQNWRTW